MTSPQGPAQGPTSVERVRVLLSLLESDDVALAGPVAAVNALVRSDTGGWLKPLSVDAEGVEDWNPRHRYGADLLAARLFRRKDSPAGVLPFGIEGAAYVQRNDPDVALLLEMGAYSPLRVG